MKVYEGNNHLPRPSQNVPYLSVHYLLRHEPSVVAANRSVPTKADTPVDVGSDVTSFIVGENSSCSLPASRALSPFVAAVHFLLQQQKGSPARMQQKGPYIKQ